jgi:hypothetical protein
VENKLDMPGETNLDLLLNSMKPVLHDGEYVFCVVDDPTGLDPSDIILLFREDKGYTIIVEKRIADRMGFHYTYISSLISLTVHSSLEAVGFTAAFSKALADDGISCNVVAGYYHDHIFISRADANRAMETLNRLSGGQNNAAHP